MSPELEVLDQLVGGEMSVAVLCRLFHGRDRFVQAVTCMVAAGEVRLTDSRSVDVPAWNWKHALQKCLEDPADEYRLAITDAGCRRIGQG